LFVLCENTQQQPYDITDSITNDVTNRVTIHQPHGVTHHIANRVTIHQQA